MRYLGVRITSTLPVALALLALEPSGQPRAVWPRVSAEITDGFADRVIRELRAGRAVGLITLRDAPATRLLTDVVERL